jgi:opacity protein-like surface antigen
MIKGIINSLEKLALVALVCAPVANADMSNLKFYAGAGLDYNSYSKDNEFTKHVNSLKVNGLGFVVPFVGVKFHENFGLELGYSWNKKLKIGETNSSTVKTFEPKVRNMFVDVMGCMPAVANNMDLLAGVGVGRLRVKSSDMNITYQGAASATATTVKNKTKWRLKIGGQYHCFDSMAVRVLATYQSINNKAEYTESGAKKEPKMLKNMKSIGVSALYKF